MVAPRPRAARAGATGIHYLHVRSIVTQNHGRAAVTIQIQEWESDCLSTITHSVNMRLTAESEIPIFQYSDGAAGGARARARVKEGGEEGAHWDWWCGRAA